MTDDHEWVVPAKLAKRHAWWRLFWRHTWSVWSEPFKGMFETRWDRFLQSMPEVSFLQKRTCVDCLLEQRRRVSAARFDED